MGPGLPQFFLHFSPVSCTFPFVRLWGGGGPVGQGGGDKNVIRSPCTKHWYLPRFHLSGKHGARMWNKTRCHKRPCFSRRCPEHRYLQHFCLFVQHTAQGCGTSKAVTSVHAFGDQAQNTGVYSVFACWLGSGLTQSISETETQCNSKNPAAKSKKPSSFLVRFEDCFFRGRVKTREKRTLPRKSMATQDPLSW